MRSDLKSPTQYRQSQQCVVQFVYMYMWLHMKTLVPFCLDHHPPSQRLCLLRSSDSIHSICMNECWNISLCCTTWHATVHWTGTGGWNMQMYKFLLQFWKIYSSDVRFLTGKQEKNPLVSMAMCPNWVCCFPPTSFSTSAVCGDVTRRWSHEDKTALNRFQGVEKAKQRERSALKFHGNMHNDKNQVKGRELC